MLDINVLAELMKRSPAEAVTVWMSAQPAASLFTTTITEAETLCGLALLPAGRRRTLLTAAANAMFEVEFAGRILGFDSAAAREFAVIAATRRQLGRPIAQADAQIAAIARYALRAVVEAALAHVVRDKTEAAYFRSDPLDLRRKLMDNWAKFTTTASAKVMPIRA
jgi:predicted nucleic acid-binding protein